MWASANSNSKDRSHGRSIFARSCATCHKLFDEGAKIGPELTGAQRANPEYILTKVLDPNAVVGRVWVVVLVSVLTPSYPGNSLALLITTAGLSSWLGWTIPLLIAEWRLDRDHSRRREPSPVRSG